MAELARGTVNDRPWGRTLGALALRGLTGQVNVTSDGKVYSVGFHNGAVVGAHSPNMADSAARMALTAGLVSSSQVAEIVKRQLADKARDEIDVIGEFIHLPGDHAMRLRRRAIAQKSARTFALDRGDFVVEDHITVRFVPGSELDIRAIIYLGAKSFLTENRLNRDLGQIGAWFKLKPELHEYLPQFGFGADEHPVLEALADGIGLGELEAPEIDQRIARAMIYTLASCGQLEIESQPRPPQRRHFAAPPRPAAPQGMPAAQRPPTPHGGTPAAQRPSTPHAGMPAASRPHAAAGAPVAPMPASPSGGVPSAPMPASSSDRVPRAPQAASQSGPIRAPQSGPIRAPQAASQSGPIRTPVHGTPSAGPRAQAQTASPPRAKADTLSQPTYRRSDTQTDPPTERRRTPTGSPTLRRPKSNTQQAGDVEKLIRQRLSVLDAGGDHFQLLGIARESNNAHIQKAYFALARQLHPDRLTAMGITDDNKQAQRLFAQVNTAFSVLANERKREEYLDVLDRGGEAAVRAEQHAAEQMAQRVLESEEAFRKGEAALRRDSVPIAIKELEHAVSLNPDEPDYIAMLAWAKFCGAGDKMSAGNPTRKSLRSVIDRAPSNITARFYLGRVERMLGKDREALELFEEVLELSPHHSEATAEVRVLQSRLGGGDKGGGGLFSRLKR